jgi:hypothetical protein
MKRSTLLIAAAVLSLAPVANVFGCPMCKDSVGNKDEAIIGTPGEGGGGGGLPGGFNSNVYYMLTGFSVVLGGVLGVVVRTVRSTDAQQHPTGGFPVEPQNPPQDQA